MAMALRTLTRLACVLASLSSVALVAASEGQVTGVVRYVTDGDTFRLESGERIRIADIDAPETHRDQARCAQEIAKGKASADAVRALLDHRSVRFFRLGRSYDRTVARVTLGNRDLGGLLIEMGVARPWLRGQAKPDWCAGAVRASRRRRGS